MAKFDIPWCHNEAGGLNSCPDDLILTYALLLTLLAVDLYLICLLLTANLIKRLIPVGPSQPPYKKLLALHQATKGQF